MSKQYNFNDNKCNLSENDIDQIVEIVTHRCRIKTVDKIRRVLTYFPSSIKSYGIFNRLIRENNVWIYVAGQSYPDEIRILRECILER